MSFNEQGFLSDDVEQIKRDIKAEYDSLFELGYSLNRYAHQVKYHLKPFAFEPQRLVAATLFLRILNSFAAVIRLARVAQCIDAKVVLRSALEALFILRNTTKDPQFVYTYIESDCLELLKTLNVIRECKRESFSGVKDLATDELRDSVKASIEEKGIRKLSLETLAVNVDLAVQYDLCYRSLSRDAHVTPGSLKAYWQVDEDSRITGFDWGPQIKEIPLILNTAMTTLLIALDSVLELFDLEDTKGPEFKKLEARFLSLSSECRAAAKDS